MGQSDRQHQLTLLQGVGPLAAVAAMQLGDLARAWMFLEQGRGVLLAQAMENRVEIDDLEAHHPRLAAELVRLRSVLNAPAIADASTDDEVLAGSAQGRRQAISEWNQLLAAIRAAPGFERFALGPRPEQLTSVAGDGVIVAIIPDWTQGYALIATGEGLDCVPLPGLTLRQAATMATRLNYIPQAVSLQEDSEGLTDVLAWMWEVVADPVLTHIGCRVTPGPGRPWRRLWWIPTGPMSMLPIHAAGDYGDPVPQRRSVMDRVVSSYAPTVRALDHARHQQRRRAADPLIVGIDEVAGHPRLTRATAEAALVAKALASASPPLLNTSANRHAVLQRLGHTNWAHFACHAVLNWDPSDSHLVLADGPLTVRQISSLHVQHAYLAYLSACTTAMGDADLIDESVHMASAFQLAGFKHVVGTLWPVSDMVAPEYASAIYRHLAGGADPALAVHWAAHEMRAEYLDAPHLWAAHVHFGP
jgi:hypothetical protein